jgi:L-lactate dehydrogenase complex protein LldG
VIENSLNEFPAEILTVNPPGEQTAPFRDQKRTDNFRLEVEALGGRFTLCSPDEVAEKALQIIRAHGIDQILAWDASCLPDNLLERLSEEGIHFSYPTSETLESRSQILVGLTGAYAGLADTGSLVLLGGQGKPMTTSLLPQIHIAILCEVNICVNLDQVLTRDEVKMASSAVVITGPSRTSDIEMTLTVGVHGPGELYVICLKDE